MSQENVEVVREIYRAWQMGDFQAALARFDEEVEWFGPPDVTDNFGRGHEGVRNALARWVGTWDDYHFELRELIDAGDKVLATGWQRGRGKGSGVEVSEEIFSAWTVGAGKVVRQRMFRDRSQALEAVGLSE